jgi:thiamine phosphate synthase YjbQ (UPF0047 family)
MENILDIYKRPYDEKNPVINMDESPVQLIGEIRPPIEMEKGKEQKIDSEYVRKGVCEIFMAVEALAGKRIVKVTETRTKKDWAEFIKELADGYKNAEKITLIMDNLNTHFAGSLYETFAPEEAKLLMERFKFEYTPKHGSWLNIAEIELNVLKGQCLKRRIPDIEKVRKEVKAWENSRNNKEANSTLSD